MLLLIDVSPFNSAGELLCSHMREIILDLLPVPGWGTDSSHFTDRYLSIGVYGEDP